MHLNLLQRANKASIWTDGSIKAGTAWDSKIKAALESSQMILILVTKAALNSKYIEDFEMKRAYEKANEGTARVVCVIMNDCRWKDITTGVKGDKRVLGDFQAINPRGKSIYDPGQPSLDIAMDEAADAIWESLKDFLAGNRD